jgi:microcystin-dependent protein
MTIGLTFNVASSGSPTLAVDGGAATAIVTAPGSPASVTNGVPYTLLYNAGSNSWIVRGGTAGGVPLGGLVPYTGAVVPNASYVFANGQCISTATYATYWALLGSPAPGACGAGFFQVIDLRGRSLAGLDTMPGSVAAGRLTSSVTGCGTAMTSVGAFCANGSESHPLSVGEMPPHTHHITWNDPQHTHTLQLIANYTISGGGPTNLVGANGSTATTSSSATGITIGVGGNNLTDSAGIGTAFSKIPPLIGVNYIIRVL